MLVDAAAAGRPGSLLATLQLSSLGCTAVMSSAPTTSCPCCCCSCFSGILCSGSLLSRYTHSPSAWRAMGMTVLHSGMSWEWWMLCLFESNRSCCVATFDLVPKSRPPFSCASNGCTGFHSHAETAHAKIAQNNVTRLLHARLREQPTKLHNLKNLCDFQ